MYTRNKTFKNALIVSLLFHGIALLVLDRNLKLSFLNVIESMPVIAISLSPAASDPAADIIEPEKIHETPSEPPLRETVNQLEESAASLNEPVVQDKEPVEPVNELVEAVVVADQQNLVPDTEDHEPPLQKTGLVESEAERLTQGNALPMQDVQPVESAGFAGQKLDAMDFSGSARMPAPSYPSQAKRMEWEGDVTVSFVINKKGKVESILLEKSSGHELLDKAVLNTVKKGWRFPRRDESVQVWKTFSFRLI